MTARSALSRAALAAVAGLVLLLVGLVGAPAAQAHTELVSSKIGRASCRERVCSTV